MDETNSPRGAQSTDLLDQGISLISAASEIGVPIRLIGGLAIQHLTPKFRPRAREGQDLDLASVSSARRELTEFLVRRGYAGDKNFNALYGHKQLYFASPETGLHIDVMVDRLEMSHTLEFAKRITRMPFTLDACDLLLSKLQIIELNEKDAHDVIYLLAAVEIRSGEEPGTIGLGRFASVVGEDWGWWRTVTMNLDKIERLAAGPLAEIVPASAQHSPIAQLAELRQAADEAPKSRRWRMRSRLGDRVKWYQEPQESPH
jgi:hypothetical protein